MLCSLVHANTQEEVAAYIGAKVYFDPEHPDNDDVLVHMIGDDIGIIITSEFVAEEEDEYHILSVSFQMSSDDEASLFGLPEGTTHFLISDIAADRFLLKADS